jgi:hypothetical protein
VWRRDLPSLLRYQVRNESQSDRHVVHELRAQWTKQLNRYRSHGGSLCVRMGINDSGRWLNEDSLLLHQKQSHFTPYIVFHVAACKRVWLAQEHVAVVYVTSAQASTSLLAYYRRAANPICGLACACIITSLNTSDVSLAQGALK